MLRFDYSDFPKPYSEDDAILGALSYSSGSMVRPRNAVACQQGCSKLFDANGMQ